MTYILIVFLFDIVDGNIFFYKLGQNKTSLTWSTCSIKKWIKQCWPIADISLYHTHTWQSGKLEWWESWRNWTESIGTHLTHIHHDAWKKNVVHISLYSSLFLFFRDDGLSHEVTEFREAGMQMYLNLKLSVTKSLLRCSCPHCEKKMNQVTYNFHLKTEIFTVSTGEELGSQKR